MPPILPERRSFSYAPPSGEIEVIHQGQDYVIINKPSGLLSVPGKSHPDCVEARLKKKFPEGLTIHRLDMATSGIMVFALSAHAQRHLGLQFEKRQIEKTYISRVDGYVEKNTGEIDLPLIADWPNRPRQMVSYEHGKSALTTWEVLDRQDDVTRIALYPKTGRSHQLRVHMFALGHPILGDRIYAEDRIFHAAPRLQLHAQTISFREPTGGKFVNYEINCSF
ncbi:MAG: pseudouridine synthase [Litorimonas sp.]